MDVDSTKKKVTFYCKTKSETTQLSPECSDEYICVGISNCVYHTDKAGVSVSETCF